MSELPTSKAEPVALLFAETSVPNKSVHFSFQRKNSKDGALNCRIPARQLNAMIENLKRVQEAMESDGVDTGRDCSVLVPAAPYGFFE